jgi:uncharacterized protein YpbB
MIVGDAFNHGESVQDLCEHFHVQADTILDHLARYLMAGNRLNRTTDLLSFSHLDPDQQVQVFQAFAETGTSQLKPIFDKLNRTVSYDELKILRMCHLANEPEGTQDQ